MVRIFERLYPMDRVEKEVHQYQLLISMKIKTNEKLSFERNFTVCNDVSDISDRAMIFGRYISLVFNNFC
jgi:hypothetical protein